MSDAAPGCRLRYSARAKRLRLVVKPAGAELVIPPGVGREQALAFMEQHRAWAERKLAEFRARAATATAPVGFLAGATLPFQGREVALDIVLSPDRRTRVEFDQGFRIALPATASGPTEQRVKAALSAWIKTWMADEAARIVARHAVRYGLEPRSIRIKRMKSRWGSCGARGDINLNWLLAFAPPTVLEYVVVHELCHLRRRDHSAAFWDLVARHLPGWLQERQWLKRHGGELLRRFA
ncbi:M48 family metallopeptidase [Methylomagnum ishizawai]|uniref:M48 family metallopeptidase n=1 Tax=Methylomagnum ishizawai TaxID=1760988 RepID=UPI001C329A49|nr:SprT family zinc-dependent metalloprotease [Methylomagnum ishizawai]BBL74789.1 hypothetical protein MishRS11D_18870 [Methylomagnum ishizawai]